MQNYSYLFTTDKPAGFDQKLRISDGNGKSFEKPFTHTTNSNVDGVRLEVDFSMDQIAWDKNKIYKLAIVNIPKEANADITSNISSITTAVEGADGVEITRQQAMEVLKQLSEKEIYALHFKSSQYATFTEKIKAFDKQAGGWRKYVEPFIHHINTNLKQPELFDAYEISGVHDALPVIRFEAQVNNTNWYAQTFYKNMYQSNNQVQVPVQRVEIVTQHPEKLVTDDEIQTGIASGFGADQGIFRYDLAYFCARDFFVVKKDIAKKALREQVSKQEIELITTDFPPVVFKGDYPVRVSYVLPGREIKTSTVNMTMYNPVTP
jgi:hypothetical protein